MVLLQTSLLVIGGGPVGLSTAMFAARAGLDTVLLERRPTTSTLPRATHISRRSMELFRAAGLEEGIRRVGLEVIAHDDPRGPATSSQTLSRIVVGVSTLAAMDQAVVLETGEEEMGVPGPCPPFWCGQDRLEPILLAQARSAGADLRFGHELLDLDVRPDGAIAVVQGPDGQLKVGARYVVAADGGRNRTGQAVGIESHGLGEVGQRVTVLFRADLDRVTGGRRYFMSMIEGPEFSGAVMALNEPGRWAAALPIRPELGHRPEDFTSERCEELLHRAIGDDSVPVQIEGNFTWSASHRIADRYRSGPLFLAGDAAHVHPPSGGYGSNVGFQDAHNLAWKLAAVQHGWAGPGLLDSYEAERRPVAQATAEQSLLLDGHGELLGDVAPADPGTLLIGYAYSGSPAVVDSPRHGPLEGPANPDGRPGTRVPHLSGDLNTCPSRRSSTTDECQNTFVLLTADTRWRAVATAVRAALGVPLRTLVAAQRVPDADLRLDRTGPDLAQACGIGPGGAVLVRPDGMVGWRVRRTPDDAAQALQDALTAILARPRQTLTHHHLARKDPVPS